MWKRSTYSALGCLPASALLASLALLPSSAWAARGEQKADRGTSTQQTQTQERAQSRQTPAQPSGSVLIAPAPAALTARIDRGNAAAPMPSQPREASAPSQNSAPRADPYQNYRQLGPRTSAPQAGLADRRITPPEQWQGSRSDLPSLPQAPPLIQPPPASPDPYELYRAPARVSPGGPLFSGASPARQPSVVPSPEGSGGTWEQMPTLIRKPQSGQSAVADRGAAVSPTEPTTGTRRLVVPEASFRGPGSESTVRVVAPEEGKQVPARLQDWVRRQNAERGRANSKRPLVDVVGNPVPKDTVLLNRNSNYTKIVNTFGSPGFSYVVAPGAVWGGDTVVLLDLFYPFYYSDPDFAGFLYPGYYPSVYAYFGWSPGWVYPQRVYCAPGDYVYVPAPSDTGYGLDDTGADRAISDVRQAWLDGDIGPLAAHLTDQIDIRIYFDGEYSYSTTAEDFYAMTLDTLSTTGTLAMDFDDPIWISSQEVFYTGRQVFDDPDGEQHTVYVSFRFRKLGGDWYLVALGTAKTPIEHQYTDFRYSN